MNQVKETRKYRPGYEFWGFTIPIYMLEAIKRYIEYGKKPGDFLTALISNDLKEAVGRADDHNVLNLKAFVAYFYNHAPSECWGSKEKMINWINKKSN